MNRNTRERIFRFLLVVIFVSGLSLSALPGAAQAKTAEAGQTASPAAAAGRPLAELLNEDGTLDLASGYRGSVDPAGWRLASAEGEPPRFALLAANDHWASGFHAPGTSNSVSALALDGSGNLYAGGGFTTAGGTPASYIARWDGSAWSALGSGMNNGVNALAVDGSGNLYAGGGFTTAGGISANRIARWDGSTWSALGSGMNSTVRALALDGSGNLYAGGAFTTAGGSPANYIARWDGSAWSALGSGMNNVVNALALDGSGNLYAGGGFTTAGGSPANYIARWDGMAWSALGSGMNTWVMALALDGSGNLYAGGFFTTAGGGPANRIARWDGSTWSALGSGMNNDVYALAVDGSGNLYAGGQFITAGGTPANCIARWDGSAWSALGSGMSGGVITTVYALAVDGSGGLYAGGEFTSAGGIPASYIARWDEMAWSALGSGNGMNHDVYALALDGSGNLYAGGYFTGAGGIPANRIARWDGSAWSALDSGMDGGVLALVVDGSGNLYAGGSFTTAGGSPANYIARWDGTAWSALGSGMNNVVNALALDGSGNLYAGGSFTTAGGNPANRIARWDGTVWSALGSGMNSGVNALVLDGSGNLYAGGNFTTAGGISANRIARWNGSSWLPLGSGMNSEVNALVVDGSGNLYAGGGFTSVGGSPANRIARWDGSTWSVLGPGMNSLVIALALDGSGNLYAGGAFTTAGGNPANRIARWDGLTWSALGSGMNNNVRTLAIDGSDNLYAGGIFTTAGGKSSSRIAQWGNQQPVADDDSYTVVEDSADDPLDVLNGDADAENDPLAITAVGVPDQGGTAIHSGAVVTYTPAADFYGVEIFTYTVSDGYGGFGTATVSVAVTNVNDPPAAGDDQLTAAEDSTSGLEVLANDSYLPDPPEILTIFAVGIPDQGGTVVNGGTVITYTPALNFFGMETFTYTISDGNGGSDTASVTVTVTSVNDSPALDPVSDQSVDELVALAFTATASDVDLGDVLTFSLDPGAPAGAAIDPVTGAFTWMPSEVQGPGMYPVTVSVTDNGSPVMGDFETISITVNEVNLAPVLGFIGDQSGDEDTLISFDADASDADLPANTLTFSLDPGAPAGASINASTGVFTWTPTEAQGPGVYTLTVRVGDDGVPALDDFETINITVNEANAAPVLDPIGDQGGDELTLISFAATATDSDPGGDTLTFSLDPSAPTGAAIDPSTGAFTWTPTEAQGPGVYNVTARVTDNGTPALDDFETIQITVSEINLPPGAADDLYSTLEDTPLAVAAPGLLVNDTDPDLPPNALSTAIGTPPALGTLALAADGSFVYTPTLNFNGAVTFVYILSDGVLTDTATATITVTAVNDPPVLTPIGDQAVDELALLSFTASASDVELDDFTFSLDPGAPAGAAIDPATGAFTWMPDETQGPGVYPVIVRVTDNGAPNLSDTETINITVNEVNVAPALAAIGDQSGDELTLITFDANATDADLPANTLTFSLDPGAPGGASINSSTGVFTWTPSEAQGPGAYPITVRVTDNGSPALDDFETINITVNEVNVAPVLDPIGNQTVDEGSQLAFTATATDADDPANTLTFSLDAGAPAGASITPGGDFTWMPTESQGPGVYTLIVRVTDDGTPILDDFETIQITVNEVNTAPVLDPVSDQGGDELTLISFTATATDLDDPANNLTFSLDAGAPAGASIDPASGAFTWTPDESQGPGVYPVTVRVTDDGAPTLDDFETLDITVGEVNQAPTAVNDTYATDEDTPLVVSAPGLLLNDSDPDLPPNALSAVLDTPPALGELALAADGSFVYTPTLDFNGLVTFTYHANDGLVSSNVALVSIDVTSVNDAPVAEGQVFTTAEDTAYSGALASNDVDGDPLAFSLDTAPAHGSVAIAADGVFTYTPTLNYNGPDSFTFAVSDGSLSDLGQVTITVDPVNDAPLPEAGADQTADEGELVSFAGAYTDPGLLNIQAVEIAWNFGDGATMTGTLTPTHAYADDGVYTVTLTVDDGEGGVASDALVVSVDNVAPNLAPIADQSVVAGVILTVTASYTDPGQSDTQTAVIAWGDGLTETLNLAAGLSSFDFAHAYDTAGVYTVTVTLTDDDGGQGVVTFIVEVTPAGFTTFLPVIRR